MSRRKHRATPRNKLYYRGTDIEVRLGDRVIVRRLLCGPIEGVVSYVPGQSPFNRNFESTYMGLSDWAITLSHGGILSWLYAPEQSQPSRRIQFVERGLADYRGIQPDDVVDDQQCLDDDGN